MNTLYVLSAIFIGACSLSMEAVTICLQSFRSADQTHTISVYFESHDSQLAQKIELPVHTFPKVHQQRRALLAHARQSSPKSVWFVESFFPTAAEFAKLTPEHRRFAFIAKSVAHQETPHDQLVELVDTLEQTPAAHFHNIDTHRRWRKELTGFPEVEGAVPPIFMELVQQELKEASHLVTTYHSELRRIPSVTNNTAFKDQLAAYRTHDAYKTDQNALTQLLLSKEHHKADPAFEAQFLQLLDTKIEGITDIRVVIGSNHAERICKLLEARDYTPLKTYGKPLSYYSQLYKGRAMSTKEARELIESMCLPAHIIEQSFKKHTGTSLCKYASFAGATGAALAATLYYAAYQSAFLQ